MNCQAARRHLSPYLDSELDPTTTFAISEHLQACKDCRRRFDAERRVDQEIAGELDAGDVSDQVWREALRPLEAPLWRRWRVLMPLATAAVVVIAIGIGWLTSSPSSQPHWVVREFLAETNGGQPFKTANAETVPAGMTMPLRPFSDLIVRLTPEVALDHVVQFVRMDTVRNADGTEIVEVRLNCCGEPVIVRAAKRDRPGRLREFLEADETRLASLSNAGDVAVARREVGDYVVVAVSRHPTQELLTAMTVQ